jgi:hypoxanthine phosphoribosyltransferase
MTDPASEQANTEPAAKDQPHEARPAESAFAHASEAEMARILDFYAVQWEYEPHRFPILWNLDGAVVESFSPDFYLPDLGIYLEMTTLRQRLVRKKNRKLRRLRELYPDIRIKLFYARDFRALMLKYGKLALVDALSGTPGQVGARVEPVVLAEVLDDETVVPAAPEELAAPEALAGPGAPTMPEPLAPPVASPASVPAAPAASPPASRAPRRRSGASRRAARRPARPERPGGSR